MIVQSRYEDLRRVDVFGVDWVRVVQKWAVGD